MIGAILGEDDGAAGFQPGGGVAEKNARIPATASAMAAAITVGSGVAAGRGGREDYSNRRVEGACAVLMAAWLRKVPRPGGSWRLAPGPPRTSMS